MLRFKHRIPVIAETNFGAKIDDGFRFVGAFHEVKKWLHDAGTKQLQRGGPLPVGWDWRVVSRKKRKRSQDCRNPTYTCLPADEWTGWSRRMCHQQIGDLHRSN